MKADQPAPRATPVPICEDCGEPAQRETIDGVWLCAGDWQRLLDQAEGVETENAN